MTEPCPGDPSLQFQNGDVYRADHVAECYKLGKEKGVDYLGEEEKEPFHLKHLRGVFVYWAVGMGLGILAFLGESVLKRK